VTKIRPLRTRTRGEDGLTLVELLVVLVLLGIIGAGVVTSVVVGLRSASTTTARVDAQQELEVALQRVTRDLRVARSFEITENFTHELGADIVREGNPERIFYRLEPNLDDPDTNQLVRVDGDDGTRTLISLVANDEDNEPIYRYLDRFGQPITCGALGPEECAAQELMPRTRQIEVVLFRTLRDRDPVRVQTTITARNLRYGSAPS
jgi:prepilin-type N-terminal cleavage/methylation domain-containing protein